MIERVKQAIHGWTGRIGGASEDRSVPEWVRNGELSARGSELRYWRETGLEKGSDLYAKYLAAFGISAESLQDAVVADFGSGPFGGILSALRCRHGYPIDVLADEYNAWGRSPYRIVPFSGGATEIPAGACDVVFSTNAIDHTPRPELIATEISRILRPDGRLYLHVHCRTDAELNKIHPVVWDRDVMRRVFAGFEVEVEWVEHTDHVNGNPYRTLYGILRNREPA